MKQFFKYVFASAFGFIIAGAVLIGLFFVILFGAVSAMEGSIKSKNEVKVESNSILKIDFKNQIIDRAEKNPFQNIDLGPFQGVGNDGLNDILQAIDAAKDDDKIKGIYMNLSSFPGGLASLEEVRNALLDFKESGKWIITYGEELSQGAYYLASVSDKIYLYPQGGVQLKGLASRMMYFKEALDRLDIEVQIIRGRDNKYKSAVEPFMYDHMSDANREQMTQLLGSVWTHVIEGIAKERHLTVGELMVMTDSLQVQNSYDAVNLGLADVTKHYDEVIEELADSVDVDDIDDIEFISLMSYASTLGKVVESDEPSYKVKDKVAVVYAQGEIRSGNNGDNILGSETIAKAIREARLDSSVKAIVLRVNSPGGSALASDVIWRETALAKQVKPLIISMGDYAASGGYYISSYGDHIFAETNTITGSIGVFGMLPNTGKFLKNKLGINMDGVKTNAHSDYMSLDKPLDDFEMKTIQEGVIQIYDTFLLRVATGRGMSTKEVDAIAQGRVWTGTDALEIGLVDEIGGLNDAIAYAAKQASVESYKLEELPKQKDPFEELFASFSTEVEARYLRSKMGDNYQYVKGIQNIANMKGIQARIPFYMIENGY